MKKLAYRVEEAAELIGVCRAALFKEIRDGRLVARKMGRSTLITHEDLEDYVAKLPRQRTEAGVAA